MAEEDKHASSQLWALSLVEPLPDVIGFSTGEPQMVHHKHPERLHLDAVYTIALKIAQDRGLFFFFFKLAAMRLFCVTP